jgi:coenzyme F420-reducing hydrogenase beta subunit
MNQNPIQKKCEHDLYMSGGAVVYGDQAGRYQVELDDVSRQFTLKRADSEEQDNPLLTESFLSSDIDYNELIKYVFGSEPNTPLGHTYGTHLTQSTDYERNNLASSGGIIKETLKFLLESGKATSVITVVKNGKMLYEPVKITDIKDIDSLPPSIYHVIDTSLAIKLLKESLPGEKIVVVGTPWMIDDIYLYIKNFAPELRERISLTIGLLTGWFFNQNTVHALCKYYDINYNELDDIRYRGKGKKGMIRFYREDGSLIKEVPRFNRKSRSASEIYYNLPMFLLYVNTHNMLADLVVGDPHLGECGFSKTGINLTIARTEKVEKLLEEMHEQQKIRKLQIEDEALVRSQKRLRLYGDFAFAYAKYLRSIGIPAPNYTTPAQDLARLVPERQIKQFHRKYVDHQKLQREGNYEKLLQKYTLQSQISIALQYMSPKFFWTKLKIFLKKRHPREERFKDFV